MKKLITIAAAIFLSGCFAAGEGARGAGEVWQKTFEDWNKNAQRYTQLVGMLCGEPNEDNLTRMRNAHRGLVTAFARTDGLDLIRSRSSYPPFLIFPDAVDTVPGEVEAYVEAVRNSPTTRPREYGDTLSSITAMEYLIYANDDIIEDPARCVALKNIADTHALQTLDHSEKWTLSIQRELLEVANRSDEEYFALAMDAIRAQLRLADRFMRAPMQADGSVALDRAVTPWMQSYAHIQFLQPLEASRLIFVVGGPLKTLQTNDNAELGSQAMALYEEMAATIISFGDYDQIATDPGKLQDMWRLIEVREELYELMDGPIARALEGVYSR
ncbi:hypothetical protein [Salinibius halmophilus]|uniref:hypothetical protein n=1 Tax=Salinibius halmophilus TaxID=1853216 RepID=UPI000E6696E0|nr:hypothetical protein [Salinibius halmophilus]